MTLGDSGFPVALAGCRSLQKLHLLYSGLTSIPSHVRYLTKLQSLHLDHSLDLHTLTSDLGKLNLRGTFPHQHQTLDVTD